MTSPYALPRSGPAESALLRENVDLPAGRLEGANTEMGLRSLARLSTPEEFNDLIIRSEQDRIIRLSDVGRAELTAGWRAENGHNLRLTLRSNLRKSNHGSGRLEWLVPVGSRDAYGQPGALRFHTQIFTGYGDSLIDFNRKRTVLSIGMSLVDW